MTAGSGYIKSYRTNRVTQARIEVHDTSQPEYPEPVRSDGGKWRVVCVTHGDRSPHTSDIAEANRYASSPWGWCTECRNLNPDGVAKGQKRAQPRP